ncbi:hypothetical protein HYS30_00515, partial [Candidatus Peregrinibacteria bacterium]|nr:hypothetical protein [Candidatus Peregrinibacteria bacterium]
ATIVLPGGTASFHLVPGKDVRCHFTNEKKGKLIIIKHVINDNGGTEPARKFTLTIDGTDVSRRTVRGSEEGTEVSLTSGPYSVDERQVRGYEPSFSEQCSGTIAPGETRRCIVENNDQAGTLLVIKRVVNNNGGTKQPGDFTITVNGPAVSPSSFPGSNAGTAVSMNAGGYSVSESGPSGYAGRFSAACNGSIGIGQTKVCTVTNNDTRPPRR